ncbi:hypothetical protein CR513_23035 [Mucuna pruriens]|uniref:Uncharacterized protein n=1 Tax=Mucuna pruriens TaxID=157652 RepID=A0A371GVK7_MUCPR|nr:hypothetical protein CR513_23035 [Mucuna pruriens]
MWCTNLGASSICSWSRLSSLLGKIHTST